MNDTERLQRSANEKRRIEQLLMMHVLDVDRAGLIARGNEPLTEDQATQLSELTDRASREPIHRVLGYREFHGLKFELHKDTLEPRDDSEALVDIVLDRLSGRRADMLRFADLGTGTGALALALLTELPNATTIMTDIAEGAVDTARKNAAKNGMATRCGALQGSWLDPLQGKFDFILSNPPYIATDIIDDLDPIVRAHDPMAALDGGADGLDAYRIILTGAASYLKPGGFLALEIGYDQAESVKKLAAETGWTFEKLAKDLGGNDRAMIFTP